MISTGSRGAICSLLSLPGVLIWQERPEKEKKWCPTLTTLYIITQWIGNLRDMTEQKNPSTEQRSGQTQTVLSLLRTKYWPWGLVTHLAVWMSKSALTLLQPGSVHMLTNQHRWIRVHGQVLLLHLCSFHPPFVMWMAQHLCLQNVSTHSNPRVFCVNNQAASQVKLRGWGWFHTGLPPPPHFVNRLLLPHQFKFLACSHDLVNILLTKG